MTDTITFTIDGDDGSTDELSVPPSVLELLAERDESPAETLGDLALLSCAQQIHALNHHSRGEPDEDIRTSADETMAVFEERFGMSFAEMTGHSH